MRKIAALFTESYRECFTYRSDGSVKGANVRTITLLGMFGALAIALGAMTIVIGDFIRIGFSSIANQFVYYLFGPAVGAVFGGTMDLLKFMIHPTGAFFPGWTLNAVIAGLLYGCFFYKKPLKLWRVLAAELTVAVVCNILLGTLWLVIMYEKGFMALLPMRAAKNLVMWPVNSMVFYSLAWTMEHAGVVRMIRRATAQRG